jgi:hypothetical protein
VEIEDLELLVERSVELDLADGQVIDLVVDLIAP